jgi:hypothetical protein
MMVGTNHIVKGADVGVIQEGADSRFAGSSDFLGLIGAFLVGTRLVAIVG